jgi:hypothetical protein
MRRKWIVTKSLCLPSLLDPPLLPLTIPIRKQIDMRPHQNGVLDKLLHTIHQTIPVAAGHEMMVSRLSCVREMGIRLGDGRLVWDREHAHPSTEDAEGVDCVEGLGSSTNLGDSQRATLGGPDTPCREGDPVDLVFEDAGLMD